ncbi:TetR/AcrR family transcriptional regulator [Herbiconiux sp. A18JL235]|uniref:TetR/AcrR family transcriptional regulator n=1 Tax=Herbiconiux sp. A18JL235 TaxID=3152363 RepID=A0AB39BJ75_9MICO
MSNAVTDERLSLRERRRLEMATQVETVAMRQFIEEGYDNVSVAEICEISGISPSTFFRHFGSKDGVVVDIIRQVNGRVARWLATAGDDDRFVAPYVGALRKEYEEAGYLDSDYMYRSVKVVVGPKVRAIYLDHLSEGHAAMDAEIARRLRIPADGPEIRSVRAIQWIAIDQAMQSLLRGEQLDDLMKRIEENLVLLARMENETPR